MKFLVAIAAVLAVASAGHIVAPVVHASQHLPVIGPNGVPVDTPAVQHATAAHLAHKVEAHVRNGDFAPVVAAPHAYPAYAGVYGSPAAYPTTAVHPSSVNGVPLETPEVVAAKTEHFAAHAEALARTGHVAAVAPISPYHHVYRRSPVYTPYSYVPSSYSYGTYPYHHIYRRSPVYTPYGYISTTAAYTYGAYPYHY